MVGLAEGLADGLAVELRDVSYEPVAGSLNHLAQSRLQYNPTPPPPLLLLLRRRCRRLPLLLHNQYILLRR